MTTYSTDPALYIFTSLTAGSSHIVTATSRLETILRANRVPFKAVDIATDEKARMLWGRRAGKDDGGRMRKLPGLVQEGLVLGDLVEIEDWNEYGELKQHVKIYYDERTIPSIHDKPPEPPKPKQQPTKPAAAPAAPPAPAAAAPAPAPKPAPAPPAPPEAKADAPTSSSDPKPAPVTLPVRSVADEAAHKAKELRLKSLREKVHGKPPARERPAPLAGLSDAAVRTDDIGLQSPTSGTWKEATFSSLGEAVAARDPAQSPTSSRWRLGSATGPVSSDLAARLAAASPDDIKRVEAAAAIKEEPEPEPAEHPAKQSRADAEAKTEQSVPAAK